MRPVNEDLGSPLADRFTLTLLPPASPLLNYSNRPQCNRQATDRSLVKLAAKLTIYFPV